MTTNTDTLATVRQFFNTFDYAGLILPSGWFGRPYDNQLHLTRSEATDQSLLLELDSQLVLTFSGYPRATWIGARLQLTGFDALVWDWVEFGSTTSHHQEFTTGTVELVVPEARAKRLLDRLPMQS